MKEGNKVCTKFVMFLIAMAFCCFFLANIRQCYKDISGTDTVSVRVDSIIDTLFIVKHDTMPAEKGKTVIKYVTIPSNNDAQNGDDSDIQDTSLCDGSVILPVVQKQFSDDSTYTAYVSGPEYDQWPKLDSIIVTQREITKTIKETVTIQKKRSRFGIGLQAGYGYGFMSHKIEPYIGVGISCNIF